MTGDADELASAYRAALVGYIEAPDESGRSQAYELGHSAVRAELGVLDLVAIHRAAVEEVVTDAADRRRVQHALDFLAESLSTFEMAQRGYREVQERAAIAHDLAVTLQRSLLPEERPAPPGLELAVRYLPAGRLTEVGGDWYDVVELGEQRVGLVVGDVMGHGIHQAAVMGQLRLGLRAYLLSDDPLTEAVHRTDVLLQSLGRLETATLVVGVADLAAGTLMLANAGHPPPVLVDPTGTPSYLTGGHGRLLGLPEPTDRPVDPPQPIAPGSSVPMYTDGLIECAERAGEDPFEVLLDRVTGFEGTPDELCEQVTEAMVGDEPADDVCLLAARTVTTRA
jgi:serine phosphatase RsbU (regulator of sigma subunit)